ncbi:MAG: Response regulator receiver protein in cluster with DNA polymerase III epsilon subunit [Anaerolineae bacterium]|jgi:DNA-binding response OmpR family regulator|nr:MAG: Response regulator receiver protein in cluster with DNA polymerase III epsilon subunit [Anaerolineae bacterium]
MAKILIAEDERDIRDLIAFTLQFAGHEVITTSNGEEALQAVRAQKPQLVLLDVRMPRLTGYEVCKEIKADPETQTIPVIFLSAKGQEAEIRDGLEAGAEQYLLKPFSPDQLIEQVNKILAKR